MAVKGVALIDSRVECWDYGPVVPDIFHEFKCYGKDPITQKAVQFVASSSKGIGNLDDFEIVEISLSDDERADASDFLKKVWRLYGSISATRLSNMTHVPGSPWSQVKAKYDGSPPRGADIPDLTITEHFQSLLQKRG